MRCQKLDEVLLNAVNFVFNSLGKSCQQALYFHLKTTFNIKKVEIPNKVDEFDNAVRSIFKEGAVFLERLILKKLCEESGVEFEEKFVSDFIEAVSKIRNMASEKESLTISRFTGEVTIVKKEEGGESLGQRASILVVDDDAGIRRTLSKILEREGYLVETVENGEQAIETSKKKFFNIALIDIRLPDMNGTKILNGLKETEPRMRKIIITGFPSLENAIEAVNRGADGYVLKPFDVNELLAIIAKQLEKQREDMKYSEKKVAEFIETRARQIEIEIEKAKAENR